jgi:antitoxin component of RelBE/YafQ-DinJ toxin-antitoxin module
MKYLLDAKQVIAEIYALKVSVDTKRANQENKDAKFRDYLQICAKYGLTPEMDIQKGIQGIANAYAGGSLPLDQIQLDDKKILDAHVKKIREEEKKKKKGKEKEKEKETEDDE